MVTGKMHLVHPYILPGALGCHKILYIPIKENLVIYQNIIGPLMLIMFDWAVVFFSFFGLEPMSYSLMNFLLMEIKITCEALISL